MSRAATRTPNRPRTFHATSSTAEAEPNPDLHQLLWHLVTAHRGRAGRRPSASSSTPNCRARFLATCRPAVVRGGAAAVHRVAMWAGGPASPRARAGPLRLRHLLVAAGLIAALSFPIPLAFPVNSWRRLAVHYTDEQIAGILNRQGRLSARGERFTAVKVQGLRHHRDIPRYQPNGSDQVGGELLPIARAAKVFGIAPSTLHRWIGDGFIAAEQPTPGAPWHIRMSDDLKSQFVEEAPPGWVTMWEAMKALGVSRQTVLQRVKRGELRALHLRSGRRKGLRMELPKPPPGSSASLFDYLNEQQG